MNFKDVTWEDNEADNSTFSYIEIENYGFLSLNVNVEEDGSHIYCAFHPQETDVTEAEPEYEVEVISCLDWHTQKDEILKFADNIFRTKVLPAHQQKNVNFLRRIMKIAWKDVKCVVDDRGKLSEITYQYHEKPQRVQLVTNSATFYDDGNMFRHVIFESEDECQSVLSMIFNKLPTESK